MKISIRSMIPLLIVMLVATHASFAAPAIGPTTRVPEIDPAMGVGLLALLGGAVAIIKGRVKA